MPVRGIRRRYILFNVVGEFSPIEEAIWDTVKDSILTLYGVKGLSLIDPNLIEYNKETRNGIIRCTHDTEMFLRASLASIMNVSGVPTTFRVQRTSGTIKALRRKARI
ncbi:MAG: Rpp14/Pop5 family protein [Candidatus Bathyarchaeia archaeon]|jgi:RNase P/RNase MRP subunit POP5